MKLFSRFFESEEVDAESDISECHAIINFAREPYFERLIAYLDREGDKPLIVGDQVAMISSAARINTFKEIKAHLKKQLRDATQIIERESRNE